MQRTIILSCSQRKRTDVSPLPAIERYDGTMFRVLRRYLKNEAEENLKIVILSAKYGLICPTTEIENYEKKLAAKEVEKLQKTIVRQSQEKLADNCSKKVFINLGKLYQLASSPIIGHFATETDITFAAGSSGKRLSMMYDWLYGSKANLQLTNTFKKSTSTVKIRGVEIKLNREQIFEIACEKANAEATSFQSWFVEVENLRVSPKWLVSQITNLPVGEFHSDEARRVLSQLGIEVQRL